MPYLLCAAEEGGCVGLVILIENDDGGVFGGSEWELTHTAVRGRLSSTSSMARCVPSTLRSMKVCVES